jgi:preprotein translocase subunit SecB
MAETPDNTDQKAVPQEAVPQEATPQEQISIQSIYIKDISFESPNAPKIFSEKKVPKFELEMTNNITRVAENIYEVVLNVTATAKTEENTAFLVEVHQAGLFTLVGFAENKLSYMLNGVCPNILFPYVREVMSTLVSRGGFQPLYLAPVNFEALYLQRLTQNQAEKQN